MRPTLVEWYRHLRVVPEWFFSVSSILWMQGRCAVAQQPLDPAGAGTNRGQMQKLKAARLSGFVGRSAHPRSCWGSSEHHGRVLHRPRGRRGLRQVRHSDRGPAQRLLAELRQADPGRVQVEGGRLPHGRRRDLDILLRFPDCVEYGMFTSGAKQRQPARRRGPRSLRPLRGQEQRSTRCCSPPTTCRTSPTPAAAARSANGHGANRAATSETDTDMGYRAFVRTSSRSSPTWLPARTPSSRWCSA